jgi:hypothetical protein
MIGVVAVRVQPELDAPRGEAAKELARLVNRRHELDDREAALDSEQRQANEDATRLSAELADLERANAAGEQVSEKTRREAEASLTKARILAAEPWAERRAGIQAAARDEEHAIQVFVAEHLDELVAELEEDADAAADAVNRACGAVESAYLERQLVEQRLTALVGMVRIPRPGDISRTVAEDVRRAAADLLLAGGEQAPKLRVDPRKPRHPEAVAEVEEPAA